VCVIHFDACCDFVCYGCNKGDIKNIVCSDAMVRWNPHFCKTGCTISTANNSVCRGAGVTVCYDFQVRRPRVGRNPHFRSVVHYAFPTASVGCRLVRKMRTQHFTALENQWFSALDAHKGAFGFVSIDCKHDMVILVGSGDF
jgi:hypothetical protein